MANIVSDLQGRTEPLEPPGVLSPPASGQPSPLLPCWALNLHGLQQLHVLLVPSATFHLVVQLEDDFVFKLKKSDMKINKNIRWLDAGISQFIILTKNLGSTHHLPG